MFWCFGIVNNKLAEIYFEKRKGKTRIIGHCYIKKEDYKTKREQEWIKEDTVKSRFTYKNGEYKRIKIK